MTAHTQAPWTIHEDNGHVFGDGEVDYGGFRIDAQGVEQLAYVWRSNVRFGSAEPFGAQEAEANAKLIAAAPDLLAALRRSLNWLSSYPGGGAMSCYDQARAAIDKATR